MRRNGKSYFDLLDQIDEEIAANSKLRAEIETLRKKMAGMVCGTCCGVEEVCSHDKDDDPDADPSGPLIPCPVCQPKEGT